MAPRRNPDAAADAAAAAAAIYPDHGDPEFAVKLAGLEEYRLFRAVPPVAPNGPMSQEEFGTTAANACRFEKAMYQNLVAHYLSRRSPYRSLLLFHQLGTGKTCTAISIAEGLLADSAPGGAPKIWVVSSEALRDNFIANVYDTSRLVQGAAASGAATGAATAAAADGDFTDQCTGDLYRRMVYGWDRLDAEARKRKIVALVRSRYRFLTYNGFAEEISRLERAGGGALARELRGTLLIVDEAHNLRVQTSGVGADEGVGEVAEKRAAEALETFAKRAEDARIVLLTATPMYNEASEIMWLLAILTQNDRHPRALNPRRLPALFAGSGELAPGMRETLSQLASEYVSYIRGTNPFTFATRLRPDQSGVETLVADWAAPIRDGLVPTVLGAAQKRGMSKLSRSDAALFQGANMCYPSADGRAFKVGKEGFKMVFSEADSLSPLQVEYAVAGAQPLYPDAANLGSHGAKVLRVAELVGKTKGIVLVYSQFIWGGVVPLAIALEHMGYQRYGARPLLRGARLVPGAGAETRRGSAYAILSSDARLMGDTHIRDLVSEINRNENRAGSRIKVVLITPVAGEGISFRNVREVHIMDPWYHLNRLDQVIGRAIRKCSHIGLPIDKRNVTVFLHAAVPEPGATEEAPGAQASAATSARTSAATSAATSPGVSTSAAGTQAGGAVMKGNRIYADLNAYRIAAGKAIQVAEVERILRDNALDCALNREVNYFPQERYQLSIPMKTSRGAEVLWTVGDTPDMEPMCRPVVERGAAVAAAGLHPANYAELIETGLEKLRKLVLRASASSGPGAHRQRWFSRAELVVAIGLHPTVAEMVLGEAGVAHRLRRGRRLIAHRDGFVLQAEQDVREARPAATLLRIGERPPRAPAPAPAPAVATAPAAPGAPAAPEAPAAPAPSRDLAAEAAAAVLVSLEAVGDAAAAGADLGAQTFRAYSALTKETWPAVAKAIVEATEVPAKLRAAVAALEREGALITRREIGGPLAAAAGPSGARGGNYIGYLDIFKKTRAATELTDGSVYDADYGGYRDLTESERAAVISRRRFVPATALPNVLMGVMEPQAVVARAGAKATVTRFVFKLWLPEETVGERRGIVCTSPKKDALQKYLTDLGQTVRAAATKEQLCGSLGPALIGAGRAIVYPLHKPPVAAAGGGRRGLKHKK